VLVRETDSFLVPRFKYNSHNRDYLAVVPKTVILDGLWKGFPPAIRSASVKKG